MRIPQVFDFNTQEAYRPSEKSLNLLHEKKRILRLEDFNWDDELVPTLAAICLRTLAKNFRRRPCLGELDTRDRDHIQELISTELPLKLVVPLIESEQYWKRRYQTHYSLVPYQTHLGWTWKCLYLEQYLRYLLEEAEPEYKDEETFQPILNLCAPYIHVLNISQLQQWKRPNTLLPEELPLIAPVYHISFIPILKYLPHLIQLEICYSMRDVGDEYDVHMITMAVEDCENLGEAILHLKHLKILRLQKNEIECKHVQGLVKKLMHNTSLVELNLAQCRIGNLGAKCIGKFLTVHETLKVLILTNNVIGEQGVAGITWALLLPQGAHLEVLDLSLNPLGGPGCGMIMRALARGILPREISVAHCHVLEDSAQYITAMLLVNNSLQRLNISGNTFGITGGEKLLESMKINHRLIHLDMRDTQIPEDIQKEIKILLKRNYDANPLEVKRSMNMYFSQLLTIKHYEDHISKEEKREAIHSPQWSSSYKSDTSLRNYLLGAGGTDRISKTSGS